ncbi:MAG: crossover junction endodeoxyribonuclease RuvC [Bacteroidetes bacterium]|nr:MAG: crossover junction endodeoxyribonuclease RuvC [Bacteroidota bacterium]
MSARRIILGIDPGTVVTGYGILSCSGKQMELIACGAISLGRSSMEHPEKLKKIFDRVRSLIMEFGAQEMALEAPFFGKNPQSMLKLGRAQGAAMAAGLLMELPIHEYAPRKVKMAVCGNGAASKEQVLKTLQQVLRFEEKPEFLDASDALAVAVCHFYQNNKLPSAGAGGWEAFLKKNPDRVVKRGKGTLPDQM